jgi:Protein of unknown function (DUF541)
MRRILWLLALPLAAWAQLDDNTLTVSASRQLAILQRDQAVFTVNVNAPTSASLDDVLAVVGGTGISAANLSGAYTSLYTNLQVGKPSTSWTFNLTVPLAKVGATIAALQSTINASMPVTYFLSTQVSQALQAAQQCPYTALVNDATAEAQKLAAAAGAAVGPILSVSDGSTQTGGAVYAFFSVPIPALRIVDSLLGYVSSAPTPACSMTVQFALVHG